MEVKMIEIITMGVILVTVILVKHRTRQLDRNDCLVY